MFVVHYGKICVLRQSGFLEAECGKGDKNAGAGRGRQERRGPGAQGHFCVAVPHVFGAVRVHVRVAGIVALQKNTSSRRYCFCQYVVCRRRLHFVATETNDEVIDLYFFLSHKQMPKRSRF
ncbi:unnamed protein product [Ectocarpus sp. 12 AP-2014]